MLIGGYARKLGDEVYTSLTPGQTMYGVEAQANIIDGFIRGDSYREAGGIAQAAGCLCSRWRRPCCSGTEKRSPRC